MKLKKSLLTGALLLSAATAAVTANTYQTWKREQLVRLEAESLLAQTALGPVEYRIRGEGPAVLLVHGSPGGYDQSYAFSKLIGSQNYRFIAISRPGYLRTPLQTAPTPEAQADLYAALLDTLEIDQASVIAISGGGPSALQFALRHPDRCQSLVMISGVARRYSELALRKDWSLAKRLIAQLYNRLTIFDPFLYLLLPFSRLAPDQRILEELTRSVTMYRLRKSGYANDMAQFEVMPDYPLSQIQAPTLVVHGRADDEVSFADAELLAHTIPHVKLLAIARAGHLAFYTHASIVMPEIRNFLEKL